MADQKISARVSLASGAVSPASDLLGIVDSSAGASGSKKITVNDLFTGWGFTSVGSDLAKAATLQDQKNILGVTIAFDPLITGLTGSGSTNLDGVPTAGITKEIRLVLSGGKVYMYKGQLNVGPPVTEDSPRFIVADDNVNFIWTLINVVVDSMQIGFSELFSNAIEGRQNFLPKMSGVIAIERISEYIPFAIAGENIEIYEFYDKFIHIHSAGALASIDLIFPSDESTLRDGQEAIIFTDVDIASITYSLTPGTTKTINSPTSLAANKTVRFIYSQGAAMWVCTQSA